MTDVETARHALALLDLIKILHLPWVCLPSGFTNQSTGLLLPKEKNPSLLYAKVNTASTTRSLRKTHHRQPLHLPLTPLPPDNQHIDPNRQRTSRNLRQPYKPTRTLHIAIHIKIHFMRKLDLNRPRRRTTRPPPKIIALAALVLLDPIHGCRDTPHDQITEHDSPREQRGHH